MDLSIVTVSMNHLTYVKRLLKSVYEEHRPNLEFDFILVDNCSSDNTVEFVKSYYPQVRIIQNTAIFGFGANNNKGVKIAQGKVVALINPDIVLTEGCLEGLYQYIISNPKVGIVCPQLLNEDLSIQYSARRFMSAKILLNRVFSLGYDSTLNSSVSKYLMKDMKADANSYPVDWAIGAAYVVSRDFFNALGGFDEDYFLYVEDMDFCLRSWKLDKRVVYLTSVQLIHTHHRSSRKIFSKRFWLHVNSILCFFRKHGINVKSYC